MAGVIVLPNISHLYLYPSQHTVILSPKLRNNFSHSYPTYTSYYVDLTRTWTFVGYNWNTSTSATYRISPDLDYESIETKTGGLA